MQADRADRDTDICHVNLAGGFRGGERQTELLIRALHGRVGRQRVIVRFGAPLATRFGDLSDVRVVRARTRPGAVAATVGARLVHAHETHGAQVALIRNLLSGTPYVVTRRVDNAPRRDPFTRSMYHRAGAVVVLSDAIARVMAMYDADLSLRRIPSASGGLTRNDEWVRRFREQHTGRFIAGSIGALDYRKGQLILIEAAGRVVRSHPQVHFVLVGSGRDEMLMRRAAAHLPNVTFAGWSANVGDYLAAFDLFVFPSLNEGLGSTLIDAMQFGLPIVASSTGGIPELVQHGENGLLVAPGDAEALATAVTRLCERDDLRQSMAAANRRKASGFTVDVMVRRYMEVYRQWLPELRMNGTQS